MSYTVPSLVWTLIIIILVIVVIIILLKFLFYVIAIGELDTYNIQYITTTLGLSQS